MLRNATYLHEFCGNTYPIKVEFNDERTDPKSGLFEVVRLTGDRQALADFDEVHLSKSFHWPKIKKWMGDVVKGVDSKKEKSVKAQF